MNKAFFITGTDTGIGKTFFAASLAASLKNNGLSVGVFKPVESGCRVSMGETIPEDATLLKRASGCRLSREKICPYPLKKALAPALAAGMENVRVELEKIATLFEEIVDSHDVTIVEGAGGLMSPLFGDWTVLSLVRRLNVPVISVVGSRLGAINHALMTERILLDESIGFAGHVVNNLFGSSDLSTSSNPEMIAAFSRRPVLAVLPHLDSPWMEPDLFDAHFDIGVIDLDREGY